MWAYFPQLALAVFLIIALSSPAPDLHPGASTLALESSR
jgi:hypothetical protein